MYMLSKMVTTYSPKTIVQKSPHIWSQTYRRISYCSGVTLSGFKLYRPAHQSVRLNKCYIAKLTFIMSPSNFPAQQQGTACLWRKRVILRVRETGYGRGRHDEGPNDERLRRRSVRSFEVSGSQQETQVASPGQVVQETGQMLLLLASLTTYAAAAVAVVNVLAAADVAVNVDNRRRRHRIASCCNGWMTSRDHRSWVVRSSARPRVWIENGKKWKLD